MVCRTCGDSSKLVDMTAKTQLSDQVKRLQSENEQLRRDFEKVRASAETSKENVAPGSQGETITSEPAKTVEVRVHP